MEKEFEISGCVAVPPDTDMDAFVSEFLKWVESKGWYFGGGFAQIVDGYYVDSNGKKIRPVAEDGQ